MKKSDTQAVFSSVIKYFEANYKINDSGKDSIKLNSRTHTARQFVDKFKKEIDAITNYVGKVEFYSISENLKKEKNWTEEQALESMADQVFMFFKSKLTKTSKEKVTKTEGHEMYSHAFDWSNHIPVLDVKSRQHVMYNATTLCVDYQVSYLAWKDYVNSRPSEEKKLLLASSTSAIVKYDPYTANEVEFKNIDGQEKVLHLNAHKTPEWRKKARDTKQPPKMFHELMVHLFPNMECRKYIYHWMNFMLTSRNHCYLVMHGEQGVGKNTLAYVCRELVGEQNFAEVEPPFWDSRFNSELKFKRLAFFDETIITKDNVTRIRAMTNKFMSIEEKGADPITVDNHCSFILTSNSDKKNLITYDDRRFSVPILGKENIKNTLGQDWLDEFYRKTEEDTDFIAEIGWYILNHGDTGNYSEKHPYITEAFYDMVDKALSLWQRNIIELIESKISDLYLLDDLTEELRGTGRTTLAGFLENHRDREGDHYGFVGQRHDGKRCIRVSKKYMPEVLEDKNEEVEGTSALDDLDFS